MCKELREPNQKVWRQLMETVRYIHQGARDMVTVMPRTGKADSIETNLDGDCASDNIDRKTASAWFLMVG